MTPQLEQFLRGKYIKPLDERCNHRWYTSYDLSGAVYFCIDCHVKRYVSDTEARFYNKRELALYLSNGEWPIGK